jgi:enoyl-CoA hydratase
MLARMHLITLKAPGKNAMGSELMAFVRSELAKAAGAPVLIGGDGDAFSAGLNLKEVASLDEPGMARFLQLLEDMVLDLYTYAGPTVASVNGHAIAGGCVIALCCDRRVMTTSPKARIGLNEVALGLRFPPRVFNMARDRLPRRHQEEVLLGAALHDATRAVELGLVDELADDPLAVARARLDALAKHPPDAYAATKLRMRGGLLGPGDAEQARFQQEDLPSWTSDALKQKIAQLLGK